MEKQNGQLRVRATRRHAHKKVNSTSSPSYKSLQQIYGCFSKRNEQLIILRIKVAIVISIPFYVNFIVIAWEWLLTAEQVRQIAALTHESIPLDLDVFIGVET